MKLTFDGPTLQLDTDGIDDYLNRAQRSTLINTLVDENMIAINNDNDKSLSARARRIGDLRLFVEQKT